MSCELPNGGAFDANGPLRILHLEDDPCDREMVRRLMMKEGMACDFTYASSQGEFQRALENAKFDAIFADFTLPGYDGMAALALGRAKCPEVPYLFVSGTIGEKRAIESMKSGATDYVFKDHLEQLIPALRRALREAEERARRKQAEESLRLAEEKYRSIVENAVGGIFQSAPEGRYLMANPSFARILGYESPKELMTGSQNLGHHHLISLDRRDGFDLALTSMGMVQGFETPVKRKDGSDIWVSVNARSVLDVRGLVLRYEGSVEDITARKLAEDSLRKSEERFREMAENIRDVFWITSPDAQELIYISPAYEAVWGRPVGELLARPISWLEAIVLEDHPRVHQFLAQLAEGKEGRVEYRIRRPDGSERWIEDRGYPVRSLTGKVERAVGCATDITERKRLEGELRQMQKMESIGQLASGISHDFNNILTVINGHVFLLLDREDLEPEILRSLKEVYAAGERAARLTQQLLVFSRKQVMKMQGLNLNEIIETAAEMLRRLVGEHITIVLDLCDRPAIIQGDFGMLEQVLLNLSVNARDAMPKGGKLGIKTRLVTFTATDEGASPASRPGNFVCMSAEDTGCGMAPEVLARVFEPFFTTKEAGKGTGLGLATVFGIVKQHQGWAEAESRVGGGTVFKVYFPVSDCEVVESKPRLDEAKIGGGTETILLVEDEAPVRELAAAVLRRLGYRVLQAATGKEALEVWEWHAPRISLVLTDIVMPDDMSGVELAEKLWAQNPELKVIFCSGYNESMASQIFPPGRKNYLLQKPYQPKTLAKAVRDMLDA